MFTNRKYVVICNINTETDIDTGDLTYTVANVTKCMVDEDLVGVQTQQLAQIQNMTFNYSIVVDRMFYNNQKYLWLENQLYEIKGLGLAKLPKDCKLNVTILHDENIENAIRGYLNGNTPSQQ